MMMHPFMSGKKIEWHVEHFVCNWVVETKRVHSITFCMTVVKVWLFLGFWG